MATLCEIRQEIHELLKKHNVHLVIEGEGGMERNWIAVETIRTEVNEAIGSTALY